jgi:hypothetical protein
MITDTCDNIMKISVLRAGSKIMSKKYILFYLFVESIYLPSSLPFQDNRSNQVIAT